MHIALYNSLLKLLTTISLFDSSDTHEPTSNFYARFSDRRILINNLLLYLRLRSQEVSRLEMNFVPWKYYWSIISRDSANAMYFLWGKNFTRSSMGMRGTDHYQFVFVNPFTVFQVEREHSRVVNSNIPSVCVKKYCWQCMRLDTGGNVVILMVGRRDWSTHRVNQQPQIHKAATIQIVGRREKILY